MRVIADDLWFPEGTVWMGDGSLLVVEIRRRTLTQVWLDGRKRIVAELGGGMTEVIDDVAFVARSHPSPQARRGPRLPLRSIPSRLAQKGSRQSMRYW